MLSHPDEERFCRISPDGGSARTEEGVRQFMAYESKGVEPDHPDPYFTRLLNGKRWWEWTVEQYRDSWKNRADWFGFLTYRRDFKNDHRGFRMLFGGIRKSLAIMVRKRLDKKRKQKAVDAVLSQFLIVDGKVVDAAGRKFDWYDQAFEANGIPNPFFS